MSATTPAAAVSPSRRTWLRAAAVLAAIVALVVFGRSAGTRLHAFAEWVETLGPWGPIVFVAGYALASVALIPGSVLTLAAGAIFGLWLGTAYSFAGAALGSFLAFFVARKVARRPLERRFAQDRRFVAMDKAVGAHGFRITFLLRLSPIVPFNVLNYALGLTSVGFLDYAAASLGMLPGTLLYVYYGKIAGDAAALAGGAPRQKGALDWVLLGVGLVATIVLTALVARLARRALREATGDEAALREPRS